VLAAKPTLASMLQCSASSSSELYPFALLSVVHVLQNYVMQATDQLLLVCQVSTACCHLPCLPCSACPGRCSAL
jgi:hypothetical protein